MTIVAFTIEEELLFQLFLIIAEDDVYDVNDEVCSMAGSWRKLAAGLKIRRCLLPVISSKCSNDPDECLLAILEEWLKESYDVKKYGHPSWRSLVKAIYSSSGGANAALAQTIAEKHPGRVIIKLSIL